MIDAFSKFGWTVALKNKNAQTLKHSFGNILKTLKRSPKLIETDDGKETVNKTLCDFLDENKIKRYNRYTSKGAVFAERFNRTIRDL